MANEDLIGKDVAFGPVEGILEFGVGINDSTARHGDPEHAEETQAR